MITLGYRNKTTGLFRAVAAIAIGIIFLAMPGKALAIVVKVLAAFLVASGVVSLIYGYITRDKGGMSLMIVNSAVDIILGIAVYLGASFLSKFILFLVGALLVVLAVREMAALLSAKKVSQVGLVPFILPAVALIGGLFLVFNPFKEAVMGFICAVALIFYGVSELLAAFKMNKAINEYDIKMSEEKMGESAKKENELTEIVDVDCEKID